MSNQRSYLQKLRFTEDGEKNWTGRVLLYALEALGLIVLVALTASVFPSTPTPEDLPEGFVGTGNAVLRIQDQNSSEFIAGDIYLVEMENETITGTVANDTVVEIAAASYYYLNLTGYNIASGWVNCSDSDAGWETVIRVYPASDPANIECGFERINGTTGLNATDFGETTYFSIRYAYNFGYNVSLGEYYGLSNEYLPNATLQTAIALDNQFKYTALYFLFDAEINFTLGGGGCEVCVPVMADYVHLEVGGDIYTVLAVWQPLCAIQTEVTLNLVGYMAASEVSELTQVSMFVGSPDNYLSPDFVF